MIGSSWMQRVCLSSSSYNKARYTRFRRGHGSSLLAQSVKNLPARQETQVRFLGREDPLEKAMATDSSTLAWKIPWTGVQGVAKVRHDLVTKPPIGVGSWINSLFLFTRPSQYFKHVGQILLLKAQSLQHCSKGQILHWSKVKSSTGQRSNPPLAVHLVQSKNRRPYNSPQGLIWPGHRALSSISAHTSLPYSLWYWPGFLAFPSQ